MTSPGISGILSIQRLKEDSSPLLKFGQLAYFTSAFLHETLLILTLQKPDGSYRMVYDLRPINKVVIPIPCTQSFCLTHIPH
jgi:hypothetical protein